MFRHGMLMNSPLDAINRHRDCRQDRRHARRDQGAGEGNRRRRVQADRNGSDRRVSDVHPILRQVQGQEDRGARGSQPVHGSEHQHRGFDKDNLRAGKGAEGCAEQLTKATTRRAGAVRHPAGRHRRSILWTFLRIRAERKPYITGMNRSGPVDSNHSLDAPRRPRDSAWHDRAAVSPLHRTP